MEQRLIRADLLLQSIANDESDFGDKGCVQIIKHIFDAPTIDAAPVAHGQWDGWTTSAYIGTDAESEPKWADRKFFRCTLCRYGTAVKSNYCPNCGAKMDGGINDGR